MVRNMIVHNIYEFIYENTVNCKGLNVLLAKTATVRNYVQTDRGQNKIKATI